MTTKKQFHSSNLTEMANDTGIVPVAKASLLSLSDEILVIFSLIKLKLYNKTYFCLPGAHPLLPLPHSCQPALSQQVQFQTQEALSRPENCGGTQLWWRPQSHRSTAQAVPDERLARAKDLPILLLLAEPHPGLLHLGRAVHHHLTQSG